MNCNYAMLLASDSTRAVIDRQTQSLVVGAEITGRLSVRGVGMANWIIDDFGEVFKSGSIQLARSLGYTAGGKAVENYAVENIGHVAIAERPGTIHVRCRPAVMADKAIASLLYWLLDRGNPQIVVSWLDKVWNMERAMSCRVALTFLSHLMDNRTLRPGARGPKLLARKSVGAESKWLQTAHAAMPVLDEKCPTDTRRNVLDHTYHGRWSVVDMQVATGAMKLVDHGRGYPPLVPSVNEQQSFDFADLSDTKYKDWIEENFREAAKTTSSKFDDVDSIISWPRIGDMRTRYWRAIVPVQHNGDSCRLLSVSGCDSSIDLRPDLVQVNG